MYPVSLCRLKCFNRISNFLTAPFKKQCLRYCLYLVGSSCVLALALSSYPTIELHVKSIHQTYFSTHLISAPGVNQSVVIVHQASDKQVTTETTKKNPSKITKHPLPSVKSISIAPRKSADNAFFLYTDSDPPDVTVVTAYFNLGSFRKGNTDVFNTNLYMMWAAVYQYIRNPFVFYTDSEDIAKKFRTMRAGYENITKIRLVNRTSVWAFDWVDRIKKIYSTSGYPKHYPNTVVPEYTCAQHAKYAVVEEAIKKHYFNTKYFTWIDIGYFRDIVKRKKDFVIVKPHDFNDSAIAMNKIRSQNMDTRVDNIFKGNYVWIGGGMFFGTKDTLPIFIADYRQAVQHYLNMSLSSTDQQVIFSMNTNKEKLVVRQRIPIQPYVLRGPGNVWFYLGYSCYRELS